MPLILPGNVASATATTGFNVDNSCRFNDGDSPALSRTNSTFTSRKKFTISAWVKRGVIAATGTGTYPTIWTGYKSGGHRHLFYIFDMALVHLEFYGTTGGVADCYLRSSMTFKDMSAWYHVQAVIDTTDSTEADRIKMFVNGTQLTNFQGSAIYPSLNADIGSVVSGATMYWGAGSGMNSFDGYLSECTYLDGQTLAPTAFGEFDEDSPTIWKPKDFKDDVTFGNEGCYLDFADSGDLGDDESGNTNDFTETNLAATDQCTDTPTNNFCTLNPLDNYYQQATFSEGNCKVVTEGSSAVYAFVTGTIGLTAGKWYFEMKMTDSTGAGGSFYGVAAELATSASTELGQTANQIGFLNNDTTRTSNTATAFGDGDYTDNDVMMCALDMTNSRIFFGKNGVWMTPSAGSGGDPTDGTGNVALPTAVASTPIGAYLPAFGAYMNAAQTMEPNFGNPSFSITSAVSDANGYGKFEYAPPSGYLAICTKNLGSDGG